MVVVVTFSCKTFRLFLIAGEEIRPGKFAILFVIHGESWEWGSGNEFDGGILASLGNHITVTFNYRLGLLGESEYQLLIFPYSKHF